MEPHEPLATDRPVSRSDGRPLRRPIFLRVALGLLALLLSCGVGIALWVAIDYSRINREGGWGFILAAGLFAAIAAFVCVGCAVCAAISLMRREKHRALTVALLIASSLVVWTFKGMAVRVVRGFLGTNTGAADAAHTVEQR